METRAHTLFISDEGGGKELDNRKVQNEKERLRNKVGAGARRTINLKTFSSKVGKPFN